MSISSVNYSSPLDPGMYQPSVGQPVQDLKALQSALSSGNISDAQQAFTAFQNDLLGTSPTLMNTSPPTQSNQISTDMDSLSKALQSNDISGAQQAFANLKHDLRTTWHPHHHGQHSGDLAGESVTAADSSNTGASLQSDDGSILNLQA